MYNRNQNNSKVLGYVYLFLALIGLFYYLLSFTTSLQKPTTEHLLQQQHCRTMLLFCIIFELVLGIYIKSATQKMMLFFQSLATMLILTAHGFYIYAFFTIQSGIVFTSQNALDAAIVLMVIGALLHGANLLPQKPKPNNEVRKPIYDPFTDEDDY